MAENETRVLYKAIADFSSLSRSVATAKKNLAELRKEQALLNKDSAAGIATETASRGKHAKAIQGETQALAAEATTSRSAAAAVLDNAKAHREAATATESSTHAVEGHNRALNATQAVATRAARSNDRVAESSRRSERAARNQAKELSGLNRAYASSVRGGDSLHKSFKRLGDWKPNLIPPFVALVPAILGVIALLNPLISILGAGGVAALGFASSLGSIGGASLAAIPGLAALLSMIFAVKTAFSGVGNVFKTYAAAQKASRVAARTPAKEVLSQSEQLARAQESYRRSIQDVTFAEGDLDDARKGAITRLKDLQKAVDRAAQSEARAAANSQLATENYANVMADPSATKGQKMDAKVSVDEAKANQSDVVQQSIKNEQDLAEAKAKGVEGDQQVIQAQRHLIDSQNAQRDSLIELHNTQTGANETADASAKASATYQEALDRLSPSARAFVLALIDMKDEWKALQQTVQESFFSEVVGKVGKLKTLFPVLTKLLDKAAGAFGRVAGRAIDMVSSAKWVEDLGTIADQNVPLIESVGDGIMYILDAMKSVAVAAGPFATAIGEGFKNGSKNLADLMNTDTARAGLADYLDKVLDRMRQWWRIIKNIAMTLFNYSAATSDFGKWLTDGFEKVTESWRKNSEKAREAGSPFQKYLEDVKPLLSEVKGLFGDFFGWFAKTSMDPKNIGFATDILSTIRTVLGPALSDLLDTLTKSGAGEKLVEAISSIVKALDKLVAAGGTEGMTAFFDTITNLFTWLADALDSPWGVLLRPLIAGLGAFAALSFIGKFTGLTSLFGWLIKLAQTKGISSILSKLGSLGTLVGIGRGTGTRVAGRAAAGGAVAAGGAAGGTRAASLAAERAAAGGVAAAGTRGGLGAIAKSAGKIATKALGKGGLIGIAAAVTVGLATDAIRSGNTGKSGNKGSGSRVGANVADGAATGAVVGGMIGSAIPIPGVGTAVGAGVGAAVGAGVGLATSDPKDQERFWKDTGGMFSDAAKNISTWWQTSVVTPLGDFAKGVSGWWNENILTPWTAFTDMVGRLWEQYVTTPLNEFAVTVGVWWDVNIGKPLSDFATTVGVWWGVNIGKPLSDFATTVGAWWTTNVSQPLSDFATSVGTWWDVNISQPLSSFANTVGGGWDANVSKPLADFANSVGVWWNTYIGQPLSDFAGSVGSWWDINVGGVFNGIGDAWDSFLNFDLSTFLTNLFNGVAPTKKTPKGGSKRKTELRNNGGPIRRAAGGGVPGSGNSDKVPAMLTPGEYVVRKAIVSRIGMENFQRLNSGALSYAQLLQAAARNAGGPAKNKNSGTTFLNAGGLVPSIPANFGRGGGDFPSHTAPTPTSTTTQGAGITVENLTVNNPSPEPATQSVSRGLRKMAYFGTVGMS